MRSWSVCEKWLLCGVFNSTTGTAERFCVCRKAAYCATLVKLREPSPEGYREALRLYRIIIMRGTLIRARRPHAAGDEMNLE